jgi:hypothetical protein
LGSFYDGNNYFTFPLSVHLLFVSILKHIILMCC